MTQANSQQNKNKASQAAAAPKPAATPALELPKVNVTKQATSAAKILRALVGYEGSAAEKQVISSLTLDANSDARKLFFLNPQMDKQAIVVTLTNAVGFRALSQAYRILTQRSLEQDFGRELGAITASRDGFGLNAADQAKLTGLMLGQASQRRWIVGHQLVDQIGKVDELSANLFQGTTRMLAKPPVNLPPAVGKLLGKAQTTINTAIGPAGATLAALGSVKGAVVDDIRDPKAIEALIREIETAKKRGDLPEFLKAFETNKGKSLYAYLGEAVRDPALRQRVLAHLPQPISYAQLTYDAFLENIAVSMVYANDTGAQLEGKQKGYKDDKRFGHPAALLDYFGYQASDVYAGKWGFEVRFFTPKPDAKYKDVIVAFRGTEGVKIDTSPAGLAGTQDTLIGDFSPAGIGYNQIYQNKKMLDHVMALASGKGKLLMTGHSLGGALAQLAAVEYAPLTRRVVTFQGANIDQADVDRLRQYNATDGFLNPITATHYRVDGDVVPNAGEAALAGTIHYFDADWKLKGETDFNKGIAKVGNRAALGHVMPILSMYLQELDIPKDQTGLQVIKAAGIKDEQEAKGKADTRVVYGGNYSTKKDPRMVLEEGRDNASGLLSSLQARGITIPKLNYKDIYQIELPYNVLLAHLENLALKAKDYQDFVKQALKLMGLEDKQYGPISLKVDDMNRMLGASLGISSGGEVKVDKDLIYRFVDRDQLDKNSNFEELKRIWGNYR
ncbi:hypothetical protein Dxin01_00368 [Deinococcus xinjiangensis]|uniref:Lipase (Class 3) n=1 Tax=Deinococcus xinjiangensis TaxID=457454 RepID=A0ABP9V5T5_9DEIO